MRWQKNTEGQKYDSCKRTKEMEAIVCTCMGWYVECLSTGLMLSTDLHSRLGGIPGLHQSEAQRKIAEASRATGAAWWQSESYAEEANELQAERCSAGQILPGEGAHHDGKWAVAPHVQDKNDLSYLSVAPVLV